MKIGDVTAWRIQQLCAKKNITINRLATMSGITQSTLNNITSGVSKNPTISTIKKICDGLDIDIVTFFDTPEFRDLEQEIK